jgi:regulator of nucleoside diphosphate kinase
MYPRGDNFSALGGQMEEKILLSRHDALRLRSLLVLAEAKEQNREHLAALERELDRAILVDKSSLPEDRVAVHSTVTVRDVDADMMHIYTLVLPSEADAPRGRISVLAPLATALLGYRTGSEIDWHMPGGLRRIKIEAVNNAANDSGFESTAKLTA